MYGLLFFWILKTDFAVTMALIGGVEFLRFAHLRFTLLGFALLRLHSLSLPQTPRVLQFDCPVVVKSSQDLHLIFLHLLLR